MTQIHKYKYYDKHTIREKETDHCIPPWFPKSYKGAFYIIFN